jgi:hypothetical protein
VRELAVSLHTVVVENALDVLGVVGVDEDQ